jgi:O-antigen/teichoic acid export membrane protein
MTRSAESIARFRNEVRSAVFWRSGSQIAAQAIAWLSTFAVIRILSPSDYGLYAITGVVMSLLSQLNGYALANAYVRDRDAGERTLRQLFGMLIVLNAVLAAIQVAAAPWVAQFYREPLVADMLRVQALIYLTNPFLAFGYAVLARKLDFRLQSHVNIVSALLGAVAALAGALAGLGVWTLVLAPMVLFTTRAFGMWFVARTFVRPSFDFAGGWHLANYGGMVTAASLLWFVQSQADVIIAGRVTSPYWLGVYTTALFLAQIFVTKVVPPINEVAFTAYARIQDDPGVLSRAFLTSVRLVMVAAMPFCLGMAASAEPLVLFALGDKWSEAVPLVRVLAMAMPFMTLFVLFAPAVSAVGRPGLATANAAVGAIVMPVAFLVGSWFGVFGIAAAWLVAYPLLTLFAAGITLPAIGVTKRELVRAILPPVLAAIAMAAGVWALDGVFADRTALVRLAIIGPVGGAIYLGLLWLFARERLLEPIGFLRNRGSNQPEGMPAPAE